ncbi:SDR family NAD(P)-dependent oxidoreductase [Sphingobium scionense]
MKRIRAEVPSAAARFEQVDLANLRSVADFCDRLRGQRDSLDLLINNAAVMVPPQRQETVDGFELQLATNYLGHFALTAGLMPLLRNGKNARIVSLSSVAARQGAIDFDDLNARHSYNPMRSYGQSKLACLMFAFSLQRRSEAGGWGITSIAAHPGISRTDLLHNAPGRWSGVGIARSLLWFMFQPAAQGALPTLFAATSQQARGGAYYGPDRLGEMRGYPAASKILRRRWTSRLPNNCGRFQSIWSEGPSEYQRQVMRGSVAILRPDQPSCTDFRRKNSILSPK